MYNDFDDDELIRRYLNQDEKTKTDALFDKINGVIPDEKPVAARSSRAKSAAHSKTDTNLKTNALFEKINKNSRAQHSTPAVNEYAPVMPVRSSENKSASEKGQAQKTVSATKPQTVQSAPKTVAASKNKAVVDTSKRQSFEQLKKEEAEKKAKKAKRKSVWTKILLATGCFLLVAVIGFVTIFHYYFGGLEIEEVDEENLNVSSELDELMKDNPTMKKITNIALFGIDAREGEEKSRADAIIIMSINPMTGKIKLISVMRDSYVDIGDGFWDKINHSYYYGGPEGAISTLNTNFNLNITDYVTVDFSSMAQAIDALGGVDIDVDEDEMEQVNINGYEVGNGYQELTQWGYVHLTGEQAVGYARIRNLDGDKARTGRQREVVMAAVEQVKQKSILELPAIIKEVIPMLKTSMTYSEIAAFIPMLKNDITVEQTVIPGDYDGAYDAYIDEVYYMAYDLESATEHIYDFIYEDIDPNAPVSEESESTDDSYEDEAY